MLDQAVEVMQSRGLLQYGTLGLVHLGEACLIEGRRENSLELASQALALIRDLLPALDNLTRAIDAADGPQHDADGLIEGVKMVKQQLHDTLARHSVVDIESVGQPFDPNLHEAIGHLPSSEQPAMTVLEEVEQGYKLHDRVVRPSKVIVSSGPPEMVESTG